MSNDAPKISFSTMLAASGHDMKNILGSVLESLEWVHSSLDSLTPEQEEEFSKMVQLVSHVNSELMQLLSMYKFENKQYSPTLDEHAVIDFLELQAAFLQPLIKGNSCEVIIDCDEELDWAFDETMLSSAIRNAAMNALKFTKSKILLKAVVKDNMLEILVEDDGPGFPDNMLGKVSDCVSGVDFKTGSTGLGLYFSEQVANFHQKEGSKGFVELKNQAGELGGASYILLIP